MTIVKFQRGVTQKMFLRCACRLMMLYFSMKFHENILNGFQVIEWTKNDQG